MYVLGVNAYHADAAACLLHDGRLVAAAEEERFRRIKHWAGFPSEAIQYCLREAGITIGQVDHLALNQDARANLGRKIGYAIASRPDLSLVLDRLRNRRARAHALPPEFRGQVHQVEHHLAHLASAYFASPFDRAAVASIDGFGDFASAAWGVAAAEGIAIDDRVYFPHSLGVFYEALTQFLGFPHYGDEYKVMGLAPYGQPKYMREMERIVSVEADGGYRLNLEYFRHHREKFDYQWSDGVPHVGTLFSQALCDLLGPARQEGEPLTDRHRDIAHSLQRMYETAFFNLLRALHARHGVDALALAGGCAMNSVANGRIYANTPFRKLYVQAAAGDAGGAIGAALVVAQQAGSPRETVNHAYWGPQFRPNEIAALLDSRRVEIDAAGCRVVSVADCAALCERTAEAIAAGQVVGWFQGRMEWGPRALGNRSILCDPRRADMKDVLNLKIKRRESFRPFAPSILREAVSEWFETDDDVPFMTQVYTIREAQRARIPAVTHVDGSGRLQTVSRDGNALYYRLIEAFHRRTGVPMLLNTSFNENEPIVCRPEHALDCFLRTRMDTLVLGSWVVTRA